jgi:hypothetical protein
MRFADTIAQALGYQGEHLRVVDGEDTKALDAALWSWPAALAVRAPATFAFTADKRTTAALAIDHLAQHAPVPQRQIALPAGAPFGTIDVNPHLPCVSPASGVSRRDPDNQEAPQLSFIGEVRAVDCAR